MPAYGPNQIPIVVHAALMNFGDSEIQFQMAIPSVSVASSATTTIEFSIVRAYVNQWADTQVPLHYVGVHCSSLRGSSLLSSWAIRSFDDARNPVHHRQATHWHGFFRVDDTILEAILRASGSAGLFFIPKTEERKHDPRFTVVNVPSKNLPEVLDQAAKCPQSLGVVRVGEGFAIRAKRDSVGAVRSLLLPETAYVEFAQFSEEDDLYTLSHVPRITRDELDEALCQAGWSAKAIKPQGVHRWIIASQQEPKVAHIAINGQIAIIEGFNTKPMQKAAMSMVAREFKIATVHDPNTNTVSTTSRFAEIKTHMETQIEQVIDNKLQHANARIAALTDALQEMQSKTDQVQEKVSNDMGQIREEQLFARQKLKEVETSVATSSGAIIQQMQAMFTTMQANLEQSLTQKFNETDKRQRIGEVSKADPFATKS